MPDAPLPVASLVPSSQYVDESIVDHYRHMLRTGLPFKPIWLDRDARTILEGHHRWTACKREGRETIWCRWFVVAVPFTPHVHKND